MLRRCHKTLCSLPLWAKPRARRAQPRQLHHSLRARQRHIEHRSTAGLVLSQRRVDQCVHHPAHHRLGLAIVRVAFAWQMSLRMIMGSMPYPDPPSFSRVLRCNHELDSHPTSANAPRTPRARRPAHRGSELVLPNSRPILFPEAAVGDPSFAPTMEAYTAAPVRWANRADLLLNGEQNNRARQGLGAEAQTNHSLAVSSPTRRTHPSQSRGHATKGLQEGLGDGLQAGRSRRSDPPRLQEDRSQEYGERRHTGESRHEDYGAPDSQRV